MITNLNNKHLTEEQVKALQESLTNLETATVSLTVNLTPQERQQYGTINEQNKLLVNKVRDYRKNNPSQSAPDIDWNEFEKDFQSRAVLEAAINKLDAIREKLVNSKTLHDYNNYQAALEDYAYTSYKAGSQAAGYETKKNELKQFFNRSGAKKKTNTHKSDE